MAPLSTGGDTRSFFRCVGRHEARKFSKHRGSRARYWATFQAPPAAGIDTGTRAASGPRRRISGSPCLATERPGCAQALYSSYDHGNRRLLGWDINPSGCGTHFTASQTQDLTYL